MGTFGKEDIYFCKEYTMKVKGFLLIELMIGLLVSTLSMLIITHYIIEVKSAQQKALEKIESFSTARNETERKFQKN